MAHLRSDHPSERDICVTLGCHAQVSRSGVTLRCHALSLDNVTVSPAFGCNDALQTPASYLYIQTQLYYIGFTSRKPVF